MNRILSGRNSLLVYSCTPCYSNFTQNTLFWHLEEELSLPLLLPPSFLAHQLLGNMEAYGSHQLSANRLGQKKTTMTFIGGFSSIPTSTHAATSFPLPWFENCFKKGRQSQTPLMDTVKRQELQTVQREFPIGYMKQIHLPTPRVIQHWNRCSDWLENLLPPRCSNIKKSL